MDNRQELTAHDYFVFTNNLFQGNIDAIFKSKKQLGCMIEVLQRGDDSSQIVRIAVYMAIECPEALKDFREASSERLAFLASEGEKVLKDTPSLRKYAL